MIQDIAQTGLSELRQLCVVDEPLGGQINQHGASRQVKIRPGHFVMIPLDWARAANMAGSAAFCVGALLWYRHKALREEIITLSNLAAEALAIGRKRKTLGLQQLAAAGLISIRNQPGASPRVSLLPVPMPDPSSTHPQNPSR